MRWHRDIRKFGEERLTGRIETSLGASWRAGYKYKSIAGRASGGIDLTDGLCTVEDLNLERSWSLRIIRVASIATLSPLVVYLL